MAQWVSPRNSRIAATEPLMCGMAAPDSATPKPRTNSGRGT
jgi:hypothetical protein